jgi:hypothetical protein
MLSCDFAQQPRHLSPSIRMHRQHVDDVGPVGLSLEARAAICDRLPLGWSFTQSR